MAGKSSGKAEIRERKTGPCACPKWTEPQRTEDSREFCRTKDGGKKAKKNIRHGFHGLDSFNTFFIHALREIRV